MLAGGYGSGLESIQPATKMGHECHEQRPHVSLDANHIVNSGFPGRSIVICRIPAAICMGFLFVVVALMVIIVVPTLLLS